jgi:hypothetical protein
MKRRGTYDYSKIDVLPAAWKAEGKTIPLIQGTVAEQKSMRRALRNIELADPGASEAAKHREVVLKFGSLNRDTPTPIVAQYKPPNFFIKPTVTLDRDKTKRPIIRIHSLAHELHHSKQPIAPRMDVLYKIPKKDAQRQILHLGAFLLDQRFVNMPHDERERDANAYADRVVDIRTKSPRSQLIQTPKFPKWI